MPGSPKGPTGRNDNRRSSGTRQSASSGPVQPPRNKPTPKKPSFARRRILALVLLGSLLALIVWALTWLVGLVRGSLEDNVNPPASVEPTDAPFTGQPATCDLSVVEWSFAAAAGTAGERVPFQFTVTNNGEIPCLIDAGAASLVFTVSSGDDEIWSNAHCSSSELKLLLGSGDSTERQVVWGGERSVTGCAAVDSDVQPGTYKATVTYDGVEIPEGNLIFDLS